MHSFCRQPLLSGGSWLRLSFLCLSPPSRACQDDLSRLCYQSCSQSQEESSCGCYKHSTNQWEKVRIIIINYSRVSLVGYSNWQFWSLFLICQIQKHTKFKFMFWFRDCTCIVYFILSTQNTSSPRVTCTCTCKLVPVLPCLYCNYYPCWERGYRDQALEQQEPQPTCSCTFVISCWASLCHTSRVFWLLGWAPQTNDVEYYTATMTAQYYCGVWKRDMIWFCQPPHLRLWELCVISTTPGDICMA